MGHSGVDIALDIRQRSLQVRSNAVLNAAYAPRPNESVVRMMHVLTACIHAQMLLNNYKLNKC